eukprot:8453526-Pyramimonas_sp.AAC.1
MPLATQIYVLNEQRSTARAKVTSTMHLGNVSSGKIATPRKPLGKLNPNLLLEHTPGGDVRSESAKKGRNTDFTG